MASALGTAPSLMRSLSHDDGTVLTYRFTYSSAVLALSKERVQQANAAACQAIAKATKLTWSLGYPVRDRERDTESA